MATIGHPTVTKRAYEQEADIVLRATRFAEAVIANGCPEIEAHLSTKQVLKLKAQIERDYLVSLQAWCEGHIATPGNAKVCKRCGIHIDELRPDDDERGAAP